MGGEAPHQAPNIYSIGVQKPGVIIMVLNTELGSIGRCKSLMRKVGGERKKHLWVWWYGRIE
jgi:hypothetical protein